MRVRVLGSAAGGGFPQWNCACVNCAAVRAGHPAFEPRTQDSLAVSGDGVRWLVLNASPDLGRQIQTNAVLWPKRQRETPIAAIVLTNGDLDHCLGLLTVRESQPLAIYLTDAVRRGLTAQNAFFRTLDRHARHASFRTLALDPIELRDPEDKALGLSLQAFPVPGQLPIHLRGLQEPDAMDNIAVLVRDLDSGRSLLYAPGVAAASAGLSQLLAQADCVFFDGTFWSETELVDQGLGRQLARDMAHWPLAGAGASLEFLRAHARGKIVLTHVNNSNPILSRESPERSEVERAGAAVAHDGLELTL